MNTFNALSTPGFSLLPPTHISGSGLHIGGQRFPIGLSYNSAANVPSARIAIQRPMSSLYQSASRLHSIDPLEMLYGPSQNQFFITASPVYAPARPVQSSNTFATLNNDWDWSNNLYTQPAPRTPTFSPIEPVTYSGMTSTFNDVSDLTSLMPHFDTFQTPGSNANQRMSGRGSSATGASELRDFIRQQTNNEQIRQQPRESWGATDLMRQLQRESTAPAQQQSPPSYHYRNLATRSSNMTPRGIARVCVVKLNEEAQELLKTLRSNPRDELRINYKNNVGIDSGGLTRQAFDNAHTQLLNKANGLFKKIETEIETETETAVENQSNQPTQKTIVEFEVNLEAQTSDARDFGLILGRIAKIDGGVGRELNDDFFVKLHGALQIVGQHQGSIEQILGRASKDQLIKTLKTFDPNTYGTEANSAYLNEMDHEDIADLVKEKTGHFLTMATAYKSTGAHVSSTPARLQELICGPLDLKAVFLNTTIYKTLGNSSISAPTQKMQTVQLPLDPPKRRDRVKKFFGMKVVTPEPKFMTRMVPVSNPEHRQPVEMQVQRWFHRAFSEATPDELRNASRNFTGAASYNGHKKPIEITIHPDMGPSANYLFNAHTCFNTIGLNSRVMMNMIHAGDYDSFKAIIFGGGTQGFNRS